MRRVAHRVVVVVVGVAFVSLRPGRAAADASPAAAFGESAKQPISPELADVLSFIRNAATERRGELRAVSSLRPGADERQGAFLDYLAVLDYLPTIVYADMASSRLSYEYYDSRPDHNVIRMDVELANVPMDLRSAILVHALRHYFAVARKEPRARGRDGQHDAFEAQAIFWTVMRKPQAEAEQEKWVIYRHHQMLADAYSVGDDALSALMDSCRERGWLW